MSRLLLLDDDLELRKTVSEYLESRGHLVYASGKAEDILDHVATGQYGVAIVDLFLPDSDGLQVIEKAKALLPTLKVLAISAGSKIENETCLQCAREIGADVSLAKPFSLVELESAITTLCGIRV